MTFRFIKHLKVTTEHQQQFREKNVHRDEIWADANYLIHRFMPGIEITLTAKAGLDEKSGD